MNVDTDYEQIIERVAALDVGKAEVLCCVRIPAAGPGRVSHEVRTLNTITRSLLMLPDCLVELGVTRVVMEATGDYWEPRFYLLEEGSTTWLVNAKNIKHLPGRSETDRPDAVSLCKSQSDGCCAPVSCRRRRRSGSYAISPAIGSI